MSKKFSIVVEEKVDKYVVPVLKDRETVNTLKEMIKQYYREKGMEIDDVRFVNVGIRVQPIVNGKPMLMETVYVAVADVEKQKGGE